MGFIHKHHTTYVWISYRCQAYVCLSLQAQLDPCQSLTWLTSGSKLHSDLVAFFSGIVFQHLVLTARQARHDSTPQARLYDNAKLNFR